MLPSVKIVNGVRVGVNVYGDQISKNVKSKSANWSSFIVREKKESRKNETDKTRKNVQFLREKKTSLLLYFCFQFTLLKTVFPKKKQE